MTEKCTKTSEEIGINDNTKTAAKKKMEKVLVKT
jgi:hypothetical protein